MGVAKKRSFKITPELRNEIIKIIDERIREVHVTKDDFLELKNIVKELAVNVHTLSLKVEALAEAQRRTEEKVEALAEAQRRTEERLEALAEAQRRTEKEIQNLSKELQRTRQDLGGLAKSMSYAFENEAYRYLPKVLSKRYGITIEDKFVRAEIGGKEINFFAKAKSDGKEVYIVGEAKLRLDETKKRDDPIKELEEKVTAVKRELGEVEIIKLLVTHYATKGFLERAKKHKIVVVQSFEW